jgi:hypothetical protein
MRDLEPLFVAFTLMLTDETGPSASGFVMITCRLKIFCKNEA